MRVSGGLLGAGRNPRLFRGEELSVSRIAPVWKRPPCVCIPDFPGGPFPCAPDGKLAVDYLVLASAGGFFQYRGLNVRAWGVEAFYKANRSALVAVAC